MRHGLEVLENFVLKKMWYDYINLIALPKEILDVIFG